MPERIGEIWKRTARAGARKITLEITAEGDDQDEAAEHGRVSVQMQAVELWENWTPAVSPPLHPALKLSL